MTKSNQDATTPLSWGLQGVWNSPLQSPLPGGTIGGLRADWNSNRILQMDLWTKDNAISFSFTPRSPPPHTPHFLRDTTYSRFVHGRNGTIETNLYEGRTDLMEQGDD